MFPFDSIRVTKVAILSLCLDGSHGNCSLISPSQCLRFPAQPRSKTFCTSSFLVSVLFPLDLLSNVQFENVSETGMCTWKLQIIIFLIESVYLEVLFELSKESRNESRH